MRTGRGRLDRGRRVQRPDSGGPPVSAGGRRRPASPCGYSLVEVIVALVILQVGLLGAAGMVLTASRALSRAARTDRGLALAEAVADSLLAVGWGGEGERTEGDFVVGWSGGSAWARVEVRDPSGELVVRLPVPVGDP